MSTRPESTFEPCEYSLDPQNWAEFRALAHQALDDAIDSLENIRQRPVWQPVPSAARNHLNEDVPAEGIGLERTYEQFRQWIFPYPTGNIHPRFWGWVHGTGTAGGMMAEVLAAAMNSNCGGRDHGALYVERTVLEWCKQIFGFPVDAGGLLVSGTSMANLIALTVARNAKSSGNIRQSGLPGSQPRLVAYTSAEAHESVAKAMEILGLGNRSLRRIAVTRDFRIDLGQLCRAIAEDRENGSQPFCVIGSAGTVNTGAVDDLQAVADICRSNDLWFHVDGAFGALGVLSPEVLPLLKGIEQADSIAFDFHKWMYVQYDCGCVLVRDGKRHGETFSTRPNYLQRLDRGLAGGGTWFCDYGPELSRSFRALKVWFALKQFGTAQLGRMIAQNCHQARYLAACIKDLPDLELLVEPTLNIVCFRFVDASLSKEQTDDLNCTIVAELQEQGIAAPSTTTVNGKLAIRVAITNHRSRREDFSLLLVHVVQFGKQLLVAA